jgi:hypothetical protein
MRSLSLKWQVLALAVGAQLFAAGAAHAHSLIVTATSTCSESGPVINFTVTASLQGIDGQNNNIDVAVNGVHVFTGVFDPATGDTFSGTVPAPSGTTATVMATAIGT